MKLKMIISAVWALVFCVSTAVAGGNVTACEQEANSTECTANLKTNSVKNKKLMGQEDQRLRGLKNKPNLTPKATPPHPGG